MLTRNIPIISSGNRSLRPLNRSLIDLSTNNRLVLSTFKSASLTQLLILKLLYPHLTTTCLHIVFVSTEG